VNDERKRGREEEKERERERRVKRQVKGKKVLPSRLQTERKRLNAKQIH
jgi:hypothetical protein